MKKVLSLCRTQEFVQIFGAKAKLKKKLLLVFVNETTRLLYGAMSKWYSFGTGSYELFIIVAVKVPTKSLSLKTE
jgi:hypothetical protein